MPLFSKNNITLVFRFYIFHHALISILLVFIGIGCCIVPSKLSWKEMIILNRWFITINCLYTLVAVHRAIVAFSSRTMLARMALYVWPIELVARIVFVGYRAALSKPDTPTLLTLLSGNDVLIDFGALLLVGLGLTLVLNETRASDERALQARKAVVEGLDKDQKESGRGSQTNENEEEPLSLAGAFGNMMFGVVFSIRLAQSWGQFKSAETHSSFVQYVLIYHICVNAFGLFVITRASKRLDKVLLFALICGVLIDVALAAHGQSRFIEREGVDTILADLVTLSPWINPTIGATWTELRDFNRAYDQALKKAAVVVNGERQQSEAGPSQEERVVHTP
ncbi:MAG: hypothetical protein J3R72DRAFT_439999 [Linnemannia gamsii]|nr:MAG: hypothetical protein J3R72DRAFT_439999 [Linnemannia gamsii]